MLFPPKLLVRKSWATLLILALVGWCYMLTLFRPTVHSPLWKPLRPTPTPESAHVAVGDDSQAYVFYATANTYACSALVNAHRLRNELNSTTPVVLIAGPDVNATTLRTIAASPINITIVHDTAPRLGSNSIDYYAQVLLKLRAFRLHHVLPNLRRIIILDSDQLVRKNLDHLFALPAADVAAPLMYWGGKDGGPAGVTSALMVATLSESLWAIVDGALRAVRADEYDMDIINRVLHRRLMVLPGRYCTLNSHWEAWDTPGWFKGTNTMPNASDADLAALDAQVEVLHFTALAKPWNVVPAHINRDRTTAGKPAAHPLFTAQFAQWHALASQLCAPFLDIDVKPLVAIAPPAAERLEEPSQSPQPQPSPELEPSPTPEHPAEPNGRAAEVPPLPS